MRFLFIIIIIGYLFGPTCCFAGSIVFENANDTWLSTVFGGDDIIHGEEDIIQIYNHGLFDGRGLIKFDDIIGVSANQISLDTIITSAELHLFSYQSNSYLESIDLYQLTKDWDESTTTSNSYGSITTNSTGVVSSLAGVATSGNEYIFDVTSSLNSWLESDGVTNFGWGIISVGGSSTSHFYSSEHLTTDLRPFLVINTAMTPTPEPATMLLFGTGIAGLVGSRLRNRKK